MTGLRSLRARFILASILWTLGLLGVSHLAALALLQHHHAIVLHTHAMLLGAILFMLVGFLGVRRGLSPFDALRTRLAAVRTGSVARLEGDYPSEVMPLVNDLNALLEDRERMVRQAVAKAGDLAHGLKTPLALLTQEAARAAAAGQPELASAIDAQIERMRRQVDYHLAHARAAASGANPAARTPLREALDGLTRTLQRLHADRHLVIDSAVADDDAFRGGREDLDEMLGNVLDNACKWARSRVLVTSSIDGSTLVIAVEDDGAGLEPSLRDRVLQRGVRADEAAAGSGFGLAIVRDLVEVYGGTIALTASRLGGLCVVLRLPSANAEPITE